MILQIGKSDDDMSFEEKAELSKKVNIDFVREMHKRYGKNFIPLDISGHYDETTPHWHYRAVFVYQGKDGLEPNQTKALEMLGIERPDKTKEVGKHNNPLMTFTEEARNLYYEICECYGLEIDREVKNAERDARSLLELHDADPKLADEVAKRFGYDDFNDAKSEIDKKVNGD